MDVDNIVLVINPKLKNKLIFGVMEMKIIFSSYILAPLEEFKQKMLDKDLLINQNKQFFKVSMKTLF